jgi:hypothetical protein
MERITVIISVISAIAAAISAYFSYKNSKTTLNLFEKEKYEKLKDELNRIIEISIEYPYVESKLFTSKWLEYRESDDEKYLRYDMYCNRFYNHLHNVCEYFKYDKKKIEDFVDVKSWIRLHKLNWSNPVDENENVDGYDKEFRDFINSYLM